MNKIAEIIHPIEGFQYSVNIAYDIYDDKKIASYIPTQSSLRIIEDILSSTENKSTDRARILTGSYGKGKSHLILHILALLAGRDGNLFSTVIKKAAIIEPGMLPIPPITTITRISMDLLKSKVLGFKIPKLCP